MLSGDYFINVNVCHGPLSFAIFDFGIYCLVFCESIHFHFLTLFPSWFLCFSTVVHLYLLWLFVYIWSVYVCSFILYFVVSSVRKLKNVFKFNMQ